MTAIQPPSYLQAAEHPASTDRLTIGAMLNPGAAPLTSRGGVRPSSDGTELVVTPNGNERLTVAAGTAFVPAATGGVYVCHNDGNVSVSVTPPHPTQARKDLVIARVWDADISSLVNQWTIEVVVGTPSASPQLPPAPVNAVPLAEVLVRAGQFAVVTGEDITDRRGLRAVALGGLSPCTSTNLPVSPHMGMATYCTDTDEIRVWNGRGWRIFESSAAAAEWRAYVPGLTSPMASPEIGSGSRLGRWRVDGKTVQFRAAITLGTGYTPGAAPWQIGLPVQASTAAGLPTLVQVQAEDSSAGTFTVGQGVIDPGGIAITRVRFGAGTFATLGPTTPFTWGPGDVLHVTGTFEAA